MLATILIAFREFLEAFLIAGVFLGLSKQLNLKKELEIFLALGLGVASAFALAIGTYLFGDSARSILNESNAVLLEAYLLVFSGVFIAYVVFSLHRTMKNAQTAAIERAKSNLSETKGFDFALFATILAFILREGFEIALFTASVALFADFIVNISALFIGFAVAAVLGVGIYLAFTKLPIKKIFTVTEYGILAFGAVMTSNGIMKLGEHQFGLDMRNLAAVPLPFTDADLSLIPVAIALAYAFVVYRAFLKKKPVLQSTNAC